MNTFFAPEIIESCLASYWDVAAAMEHGKRLRVNTEFGKITAYHWNGRTYVTELEILEEAFD